MNPDRYAVIYNSKYDDNCTIFDSGSNITTAISSSPSTASSQDLYACFLFQFFAFTFVSIITLENMQQQQ
jgi:hypothetical protein